MIDEDALDVGLTGPVAMRTGQLRAAPVGDR
jgi:hypothetical protein